MWQSSSKLAALVGSRICHDLISPVGAIGNGLELLDPVESAASPEMQLIVASVANANARIRFMRIAYGTVATDQVMSAAEIVTILSDLARGARVQYDWTRPTDVTRARLQEVFLALQCLEAAMPRGGTITIRSGPDGGDGWELSAPARADHPAPALWQALSDPSRRVEVKPAEVQFALLPALLTERGHRLTIETGPEAVTLRF